LDELLETKREIELQKGQLLADLQRERDLSNNELARQIGKREDKLKEQQVLHEGQTVEIKDKFTRQIVELERQLEFLQHRYNDTTTQLTVRVGDLERSNRL